MEFAVVNLLRDTILAYAPAYIANMMPPIAGALRLPLGVSISARILGKNKTYRGLYVGVLGGMIAGWLLWKLQLGWHGSQPLSAALLAGGLMGFGALIGDVVKSAVK